MIAWTNRDAIQAQYSTANEMTGIANIIICNNDLNTQILSSSLYIF